MRVLLPLNNNQSASTGGKQKGQKSAGDPSHNESSEEETSEEEEASSSESPNSEFPAEVEIAESTPPDEADSGDTTGVVVAENNFQPLQPATVANRKRDYALSAPSELLEELAPAKCSVSNTAKRSRLGTAAGSTASDDSKPPAKPMVAPKRHIPSPSDELHDDRQSPECQWEENEPTPYGNLQHYYRNHPRNNPRLVSTTPAASAHPQMETCTASVAAAAGPKNCGDPALMGEEVKFAAALKSSGLEIVEQEGDGNCLFRAVSLQVYGDASMHGQVREQCLNFMAVNKEHFGQFMTAEEPFERYIARKRQLGVHGNNPEIQAISELFNRPVQIFSPGTGAKPLNIFHKEYKTTDAPIRLSYHDNNHYNAVIDPTNPTAGLGLGLPGLQPGLADKLQMSAATTESDLQSDLDQAITASQKDYSKFHEDQLQRLLKESSYSMDSLYKNKAMNLSDVDATNFELEQTILETSLQSYFASKQEEDGRKQRASPAGRRRRPHVPSQDAALAQDPQFSATTDSNQPPVAAAAAVATPPSPEHSSFASSSSSPAAESAAAHPIGSIDQASMYSSTTDEYPSVVQELVMNGFDLKKVVHAYELVGDKFDDLLTFLMSSGTS
ncbi:hypothetical protein ACA910_018151 [Epithemia clementina (nom. ined.)]